MSYYGKQQEGGGAAFYGASGQQQQQQGGGGAAFYGASSTTTVANSGSGGGYSTDQWQQPNPQQQQQQQQQTPQQPSQPQYNHWQPQAAPMQGQQPQTTTQPQTMQQGTTSSSSTTTSTWNPAVMTTLAGAVLSNATGGGGGSGGTTEKVVKGVVEDFLRDSGAKLIPGLEAFLLTLRAYFAVDNNYVSRKIQCLLFPFLKKDWNRNLKGYGGQDGATPLYDLPIADENAPDLYIPFMSLITYVLLAALVYGNAGKFNPEVIPDVTTKCFFTQVLEVVLMRLGFYVLLSSSQPQHQQHQHNSPIKVMHLLDLLSYTGYKYLGLSVSMLLGLMAKHFDLGARVYYSVFLYTASAASFFMFQTVSHNATSGGGIASHSNSHLSTNLKLMVLAFAGAQFATMWFVSQTKNL